MKKISIIVTAMALAVGLSQCKKEQPTTTNGNDAVAITLDIQNTGGTRMDVNTSTGEVTYETGDVIYVASGGTFIGTLTHNGTNFAGTITNPTVGEPLHFYFLGNVTPDETLTAGTTTTCSVVISDQTEHLPVIEYAPSNETYTTGATTFTAHLLNKCALVKFNVTTASEAATCITGMKNKVTVSFADNTLTHSQEGNGLITLPAGNGEKWAILLPQEAMEAGETGSAFSHDGTYTGTYGAVPAIRENGYMSAGIEVNISTQGEAPNDNPEGSINGLFTINANGNQVYFSQGNLQYRASTNTWRFAEHQWNYVGGKFNINQYGNVGGSSNDSISSTYSRWIDLFGWGTSGYNHGAVCYQPWSISTDYLQYYAYGFFNFNLNDESGKADWGYNPISNGGNQENMWRTLSKDEWVYVFNTRNTASGIRYAKAIVNGVKGMILLPDDWNSSIYSLSNANYGGAYFDGNNISGTEWLTVFEPNGAVFLPAGGYREETSIYSPSTWGYYWSSSYQINLNFFAYSIRFNETYMNEFPSYDNRYKGFSVRLVCDVP